MNPLYLMQMVQQIKSNPMAILGRYGITDASDPNKVIQDLMNKGVVSQAQYDRAVQMAKQMGMK